MAEDRRPGDPASSDPMQPQTERDDPTRPASDPVVERDPSASTRRTRTTVVNGGGRGGMVVAAVIAIIAIIAAVIAMNWDWGDPQATQMPADPAAVEEGAPAAGDDAAPADEDTAAPAGEDAEPID